jgi:5-formyltetrahydrofolate cyclo-ligase
LPLPDIDSIDVNNSSAQADRALLRKTLRQQRQLLSNTEQDYAANALYHQLIRAGLLIPAKRVAFYFANDGEIDPLKILFKALSMGKQCYLPVLSPYHKGHLCFAPFKANCTLRSNRWGILEPDVPVRNFLSPRALDLVFVPLVGFDENCIRIGMGKGYYDRSFAFKNLLGSKRPRLVGLAHDLQKVATIPGEHWDVGLDAVITEKKIYRAL